MEIKTKIMGILNITPDSFYDGIPNISEKEISSKFKKIMDADIIDIGCESSRPGASQIVSEKEIERFKLFLPFLKRNKSKIFSIDTCKYDVAKFAIENGVKIINDISAAKNNPKMLSLAAEYDTKIILMHMQGSPDMMQKNPKYSSLMDTLESYFEERISLALKYNIKLENIIIDPGIGFGKRISDNDEIIQNISRLKIFSCPILIGISRKSFLQYGNDTPQDRLPATLGATVIAVKNGVDIVRVHDVLETKSMLYSLERIISN